MSERMVELMLKTSDSVARLEKYLQELELSVQRQEKNEITTTDLNQFRDSLRRNQEDFQATILQQVQSIRNALERPQKSTERRFNIKIGWEMRKPVRLLVSFILTISAILGAWYLFLDFNPFDVRWWIWTLEQSQTTGGLPSEMVYSSIAILLVPISYRAIKWYRNRY